MVKISIDGIKINYKKIGKGPELLFFHGVFADTNTYKEVINILKKKYTVYAMDLPFFGKSDPITKDISVKDFIALVNKATEKFKLKNPTVLAHSLGGLFAIDYAIKNKIKKLILMDSAGLKYKKSKIFFLLNMALFEKIPRMIEDPYSIVKLSASGVPNFIKSAIHKSFWKLYNEGLKKDFSKKIKQIKCPTIIAWGKQDTIVDLKYAKKLQKLIKNSKLIILEGSHNWMLDNPQLIKKII